MANGGRYSSRNVLDTVRSGFSLFVDTTVSSIFSAVGMETDALMDFVEARIIVLQDRLLRNFSAAILISTSLIFLVSSGYFFLVEYLEVSKTFSFLILGLLLLFAGIVIRKYGGVYYGKE